MALALPNPAGRHIHSSWQEVIDVVFPFGPGWPAAAVRHGFKQLTRDQSPARGRKPARATLPMSLPQPAGERIRVSGLGRRYGALEVFRGIDFTAREREVVAIVGPSGCGKTTLLRCIDGLLPVDAGEIWVNQQRVTEPIPGVAMVFQHFGLFPWKTVYDNVSYGLRMAGVAKAEIARRVPAFIEMVGLSGFE